MIIVYKKIKFQYLKAKMNFLNKKIHSKKLKVKKIVEKLK